MKNKPSILYRGIIIDYNNLQNFEFSGVDLKVNKAPIIDQYGRKTVGDGNEYGVYMSDNLSMVTSAYGDLHHDVTAINNLSICYERIGIPSVAIIYQINTDGLDIRRPFILKHLKDLYNNGFQGNEWIADVVPASNYTVYRVRIGEDILHDAEDIDLSKVTNISEHVKQKVEMRKYRLETFANAMEKMSPSIRRIIGRNELSILKYIYGENGARYIDENSLVTTEVEGMLKYMEVKTIKQNEPDIDFQTIKYINELSDKATDADSIIEILKNDKIKNMQEKAAFEKRKKQEKVPYVTTKFDRQEQRLDRLMTMVLLCREKDNLYQQEETQIITPTQEYTTKETKEWEKIKKMFDYDTLDWESQQTIEQRFLDRIRKKKNKSELNDMLDNDVLENKENIGEIESSERRKL